VLAADRKKPPTASPAKAIGGYYVGLMKREPDFFWIRKWTCEAPRGGELTRLLLDLQPYDKLSGSKPEFRRRRDGEGEIRKCQGDGGF